MIDWRLYKAQAFAESTFKSTARSSSGALGLMQIMPGTGKEISRKLNLRSLNLLNTNENINAGIYYMSKMRDYWRDFFDPDKHNLALASYNAGVAVILKANSLCGKEKTFDATKKCFPLAMSKIRAIHASSYVIKVRNFYRQLLLG